MLSKPCLIAVPVRLTAGATGPALRVTASRAASSLGARAPHQHTDHCGCHAAAVPGGAAVSAVAGATVFSRGAKTSAGSLGAPSNRGVVYNGPGLVAVEPIAFPQFYQAEQKRDIHHGVILKVIVTNICGSDQHMVRSSGVVAAVV
jgi:hypothetical protein